MLSVFRTPLWGFGTLSDSSFNFQLSKDILQAGKFDFGMGFERAIEYSYNPALNMWSVSLSEMSGLSLDYIAVLLFPILSSATLLLFYYLSTRSVLGSRGASWASLIFTFNPVFIFFENSFAKEPFALIFFAICLYVVFRSLEKVKNRRLVVIGFIAAFMVIFAHQWTSYNLLITITVIWTLPWLYARSSGVIHRFSSDLRRFINPAFGIAVFTLIFSWLIFVEFDLFSRHVLSAGSFLVRSTPEVITHTMPFLSFSEKVMVYLGYVCLAVVGAIEFFKVWLKKIKTLSDLVPLLWSGFCAFYIIFYTYFLPTGITWAHIHQRGWIFAFFGLAPLIAISFAEIPMENRPQKWGKKLRAVYPLLLILPLISAILLAPINVLEPTREEPGQSFYMTAAWMREYDSNATVATDFYAWHVLIPYGRLSYYEESSTYALDISGFVDLTYKEENFESFKDRYNTFVFNKDISLWFNATADSANFDSYYNKIHDSKSLSIYESR